MTAKEHNRMVGIFLMAHGGLQAVVMVLVCILYAVLGSAILFTAKKNDEQVVGGLMIGMVVLMVGVSLMFVIPQIIGGYKLFRERANARTWGIIGSILSCFSFPLGTAAGVYGLWFLFGDMGKQFYLGGSSQHAFQKPPQPPPPNSWQ